MVAASISHLYTFLFYTHLTLVIVYYVICYIIYLNLKLSTFYSFLPESVRWLVSKKRYEEAQKIFLEASRNNGQTIPDHLLAIPPADEVTSSEENSLNENRRPFRMFWEILKTPCLIKRIFILFFAWLVYYLCIGTFKWALKCVIQLIMIGLPRCFSLLD